MKRRKYKRSHKLVIFAQGLQMLGYDVEQIMSEGLIEHIAWNRKNEKRQYLVSFDQKIRMFIMGQLCSNGQIYYYYKTKEFSDLEILDFFNVCSEIRDDFHRTLECCRDKNYIEKDSDYEELFSQWFDENKYTTSMFIGDIMTGPIETKWMVPNILELMK